MKRILTLMLAIAILPVFGQFEDSETIRNSYSFEKAGSQNVFQVSNINGFIKVKSHPGSSYILEVKKVISGKTAERVSQGMQAMQLSVIDRYDTLIVHLTGLCERFGKHKKGGKLVYGYEYNECKLEYDFQFDMTLTVPESANLILRTVNDGNIEVEGVFGALDAGNINGGIKLQDVKGKVVASSINGDVDIDYSENPNMDSRYYTLNGDINANFQTGLAAKIAFKSFNGEMYTNLDLERLPVEVRREEVKDGKGVKVKIDDRMLMQARKGSVLLDFETFNGDAYVREN